MALDQYCRKSKGTNIVEQRAKRRKQTYSNNLAFGCRVLRSRSARHWVLSA